MDQIKTFCFTLAFDYSDEDIFNAGHKIRPDWKLEEVEVKKLSGGYINRLSYVYQNSDPEKKDAVVVRISKAKRYPFVLDPLYEVQALKLAHNVGCCPPIYAFFQNGFMQKYINEQQTTAQELFKDPNCRNMATKLAKLHSLKKEHDQIPEADHRNIAFLKIHAFLDDTPDEFTHPDNEELFAQNGVSKEKVLQESYLLEKHFNPDGMRQVLSHNDFHIVNNMLDKDSGNIFFSDFEMCGINYDQFDFVYIKHAIRAFVFFGVLSPDDVPSEDDFRLFMKHYLEARACLDGGEASDVTEKDVEDFYQRNLYMEPVIMLYGPAMCLYQLNHPDPVGDSPREALLGMLPYYTGLYREKRLRILPEGVSVL